MQTVVNENAEIVQVPDDWEQCCVYHSWHQPAELVTVSFGRNWPVVFRCKPEYSGMAIQELHDAKQHFTRAYREARARLVVAELKTEGTITKAEALQRVKALYDHVHGLEDNARFDERLAETLERDFEPIFGTITYWIAEDN